MLDSTRRVIEDFEKGVAYPSFQALPDGQLPNEFFFELHPKFRFLGEGEIVEQATPWLESFPTFFRNMEIGGIYLEVLINALDAIIMREHQEPDFSTPRVLCYMAQDDNLFQGACAENGCGVPGEIREQIFKDAFFPSPKQAFKDKGVALIGGAGQGMHLSHRDIREIGGTIEFFDLPSGRTAFGFQAPNTLSKY